jgi:hypothetical protein
MEAKIVNQPFDVSGLVNLLIVAERKRGRVAGARMSGRERP